MGLDGGGGGVSSGASPLEVDAFGSSETADLLADRRFKSSELVSLNSAGLAALSIFIKIG